MEKNPFLSKTYVSIWLKHFNNSHPAIYFNFIKGLSFIKNKHLPIYFNTGRNHTNGISYSINSSTVFDFKNKVLVIMDVPSYFDIDAVVKGGVKMKKVNQYHGYLAILNSHNSFENYIRETFSAKSRSRILNYRKKLEQSFNIKYSIFYGNNISKEEYNIVFEHFNILLKKQAEEKNIINQALFTRNWDFLSELIYPMVLNKEAALFLIFDNTKPISISLSYVGNNIFTNSLMAFDSNYSKFHVGFIDIIMRFEFCIKEKIDLCDFSKGDHDYKKRWGNQIYNYEYHVFYDSSSIISFIIGSLLVFKYKLIQYLRDKNLHHLFHKIIYFFKRNKKVKSKIYKIEELNMNDNIEHKIEIDFKKIQYSFLTSSINDFLYVFSESINDIKVFSINNSNEDFILIGKQNKAKIIAKEII